MTDPKIRGGGGAASGGPVRVESEITVRLIDGENRHRGEGKAHAYGYSGVRAMGEKR